MYGRFKRLSAVPLDIGELPGSLGSIDDEIYMLRERSKPGSAGAFTLIYGV
jgi:hypothetical protein